MKKPNLGSNGDGYNNYDGMDLRDYFAANCTEEDVQYYLHVTKVDVKNTEPDRLPFDPLTYKEQSITREQAKYLYADAMLKAREVK